MQAEHNLCAVTLGCSARSALAHPPCAQNARRPARPRYAFQEPGRLAHCSNTGNQRNYYAAGAACVKVSKSSTLVPCAHKLAYLPLRSSNSACVPASSTWPASNTTILSHCAAVLSRCATNMAVRPAARDASVDSTSFSVVASSEEVASSNNRMDGSCMKRTMRWCSVHELCAQALTSATVTATKRAITSQQRRRIRRLRAP
jgi:hypothetical protein